VSKRAAVALVLLGFAPTPSLATTEGPGTVLQPILSLDAAIVGCPVTFTYRGDVWASPGCFVRRTVERNMVATERGFENRNAASLAGITIRTAPRSRPLERNESPGLFGDSLRVVLAVPPADSTFVGDASQWSGWRADLREIVATTVECMVENARLEYPRFKWLDIEVSGREDVRDLGGVFEVTARATSTPN
jgi:hypothetical protein